MSNTLSSLNSPIKINSAMISNAENRDSLVALSKRNSNDLNRLADYINNILVPSLTSLASKTRYPHDTVESGLSGLTLISYPEAQGNNRYNSELFWMPGPTPETGRPCTVKESFDYLLSNMIEKVVEVRESLVDLTPLLDQISCSGSNIVRIAMDTFGPDYTSNLNCSADAQKSFSLSEHVYQLINQLTSNPQGVATDLATGVGGYPSLNVNAAVAPATYSFAGNVEIATRDEIALATTHTSGSTGLHYLTVNTEDLYSSLGTFSLPNSGTNLLRDRIKDIAEEKVKESLVSDLADISSAGPNPNDVLSWNDANGIWEPASQTSASDKITEGDSKVEVYDTGVGDAKVEFVLNNALQLELFETKLLPTGSFSLGETGQAFKSLFLELGGLYINDQRLHVDANDDLKYNTNNSIVHHTGAATLGDYLEYANDEWTLKNISNLQQSDKIAEGDSRVEVYDTGNSAAKVEFFIDNNLQLKLLNTKLLPSTNSLFDLGDTTTPYYSLFLKSEDTNNNLATGGLHIDGQRISIDQNNNDLKYNANSVPHYSGTVTSGQYLEYDTNAWTLKDTSSLGKANLTYAACSNEEWNAAHYYKTIIPNAGPFSANDIVVLDHLPTASPSDARETLIFTFYNQSKTDVTITDLAFGCNYMDADWIEFAVWSSKESDFFNNGQVALLSDELTLPIRTSNPIHNISGCYNAEVSYTLGGEYWFGIIMLDVEKANSSKKFYCSFNVEQ
jgi:hypothetical protein